MASRQTLASLAAVSAILVIVAPFETNVRLGLAERAVYWTGLTLLCYAAGAFVNIMIEHICAHKAAAVRIVASGLVCAACILALVVLFNYVTFGWVPQGWDWVTFVGTVGAIALIVNTALVLTSQPSAETVAAPVAPVPPPLLDRLPLEKRGALVALSVEDHYVRIRTVEGEELVLLRLSDAIREVGDTRGAQVHRSHWAAWNQVVSARREGDRAILTMSQGPEVPVSRANLPKLKEAGLLPR
ncbi:LytTR family DNA-binding domain-containing protein [Primorskyibacter sp. S187A]|uniref:LytTR family DNA-binding domain-containing protein n=1 Tax=Primorskyibacter sp. S187A TaxID=3415130 RepID=UPI003C7B9794